MKALAWHGAGSIKTAKPLYLTARHCHRLSCVMPSSNASYLPLCNGCEGFHNYLYGRPLTVELNHKALESIHLNATQHQRSTIPPHAPKRLYNHTTCKLSYTPMQRCTSPTRCHGCRGQGQSRWSGDHNQGNQLAVYLVAPQRNPYTCHWRQQAKKPEGSRIYLLATEKGRT